VSPFQVPITVPGTPSRAILIAQKPGYQDSAPLTVESTFYHDAINPYRPGGVSPTLLQQTLRLVPTTAVDTIPPTTVATASPGPNTKGWNNSNVLVSLTSTDNPGGSGVKQIAVALQGAQTGTEVFTGTTASVLISAEGTTVLTYFATDNAGNQENARTLTVRIDKTSPLIAGLPGAGCTLWPPNGKLTQVAVVSATDVPSGLLSFDVTAVSNEPQDPAVPDIVITGSGLQPRVVQLRADRLGNGNGRIYTITASAADFAGNQTISKAICTVPHDQQKSR
jgi:hypothetical protein